MRVRLNMVGVLSIRKVRVGFGRGKWKVGGKSVLYYVIWNREKI